MNRLIILAISCSALAGCGVTGAAAAAAASTSQEAQVSGPNIVRGGTSTASETPSLTGEGLQINGGTELGSFLIATYSVGSASSLTTAELTVTPSAGSAFVYMLLGSGLRYSSRELRIESTPGSNVLRAATPIGNVVCGPIAPAAPNDIAIVLDATSRTFDVLIDGATSACTDLPTKVQPPISGFGMMDASNEGYGGQVAFSDLVIH
ncbi:MAG TPA: hypothetical protein VFT22_31440 [Kofleriaceae bacterium]|nr:hypothetical protein [Kofleriaceae bacterium]